MATLAWRWALLFLAPLFLALMCLAPLAALAADGQATDGAADLVTPQTTLAAVGSAALTVLVQEARGYLAGARARAQRADDERVADLRGEVKGLASLLTATREEYLKRTELDARIASMETRMETIEGEVRGIVTTVAHTQSTSDQILKILEAEKGVRRA